MSPVAEAYYPLTLMLVYSNIRNQLQGYNIETKLMELCSSRSAIRRILITVDTFKYLQLPSLTPQPTPPLTTSTAACTARSSPSHPYSRTPSGPVPALALVLSLVPGPALVLDQRRAAAC
jgi:hypothetical protein